MQQYDAVIVGGGINGLTVAAYLAKAGQRVAVFEARGQCGAHCDTIELGLPGYLHNTHAVWLVPAMSPAMIDLELERFGLDLRGTDVVYAKTFLDGTNVVNGLDPALADASLGRVSERDRQTRAAIQAYSAEHLDEALRFARTTFSPASTEATAAQAAHYEGLLHRLGLPLTGDDLLRMTGMELLDLLFESEHARTTVASLGEYTGLWPVNRRTGLQALGTAAFSALAVHTARGGSHALTHALVRCVVAHGGDIWTTCPVERILVEGGRVTGVRLSQDAVYPGEDIRARVVVSNLTLVPTFLRLLGEDVIGPSLASLVRRFSYDDPQLVAVTYALSGDPEMASAAYDPAVQRAWVGYFGGETLEEMRQALTGMAAGVIPDDIMAGVFLPTRADPTQAPPGCHTSYTWISVPAAPRRWRGRRLDGWASWRELAEPLADAVTERWEQYAPGFKDLVVERHVMTPLDQELGNPSAIRGNMIGGSAIPEQNGENRPLPGIVVGGASRSLVPGLYLSNSIHPYGATHLASGYVTATEVAEDLGCRDAEWWRAEPLDWFLANAARISVNLGVGEKWRPAVTGAS